MNRYRTDKLATGIIKTVVGLIVLTVAAILLYLIITGIDSVSLKFIFTSSQLGDGIRDQLWNSVYLLILTLLFSLPLSIGAAIALTIYAKGTKISALIQDIIQVLSSLPSIVVGLFGMALLVIRFKLSFSILSGAIALTFFNLPILTSSVALALQSVPEQRMSASVALGVSKWHTIYKIILPEAMPGIISGAVISAGRVFGEAATLIYTAGQSAPYLKYNWYFGDANNFLNPMRPAETLAVHIWKLNSENIDPNAEMISRGTIVVLIVVVLLFNLLARLSSNKLRNY